MPSGGTLIVEPLTAENVEDLVELLREVDPTHFAHTSRDAAERFLREPKDVHVIGRVEGEAVAFGMLRGWHEGYKEPSLGIAVRRTAEGRGYGRSMMGALREIALERGCTSIRLRVHPENPGAQHLYASCGYAAVGMDRGELLMRLELDPHSPNLQSPR